MSQATQEISMGKRFSFGKNWERFLNTLNEDRIAKAEASLQTMLGLNRFDGLSFLGAGSGSGLFSLAARRLGANVVSFDYDPQSVACTQELRNRYFPNNEQWRVDEGSVLDTNYLTQLGQYDIVYSWGVLHHTGALWSALRNVIPLVKEEGVLFVAIYNDQGYISQRWARIKCNYNKHKWLRPILLTYGLIQAWGITTLLDLYHLKPFASWREYGKERGMSPWQDVVDWIGGWPFEVASPEAIFRFYREHGFHLQELVTRQGLGCNEFVFLKKTK